MLTLIIASTLLFGPLPTGNVLMCEPPQSPRIELGRAAAVFSGRAISKEYVELKGGETNEGLGKGAFVTKFKVEKWWKGGNGDEVIVYTSAAKVNGGIKMLAEDANFQVGEKYLVYAFGSSKLLRTRSCTRTSTLEYSEDDLLALGKGAAPERRRR
jgi:hypothetical protein